MLHRDHLDEGTIHAWLDGALSAHEARDVEAHVASCASCAAAVAEARGLIAAASGILAKLDVVPAGVLPRPAALAPVAEGGTGGHEAGATVIPIERAQRERRPGAWWRSPSLRAAAALLLVASGTFVVAREWEGPSRTEGGAMVSFPVDRSGGTDARTSVTSRSQRAPVSPMTPPEAPLVRPPATPPVPYGAAPTGPASGTATGATATGATTAAPSPSPLTSRARADTAARRESERANDLAANVVTGEAIAGAVSSSDTIGINSALMGKVESRDAAGAAASARSAPSAPAAKAMAGMAGRYARRQAPEPPAPASTAPLARASSDVAAQLPSTTATAAVAGTVRDARSGEPLVGVSVRLRGHGRGVVSDSAGRFIFDSVPAGPKVVDARHIGFAGAAVEVLARPGSTVRADLALSVNTLNLETQVLSPAAASEVRSAVARAAGCYRLRFGDWQPSRPRPDLPGRITLDAARATVPLVAPGDSAFVVRAEDGATDGWRHMYWTPLGDDSVRVVWSDGSAGAEVRARVDGQTLRGSVATFSDDDRRPVQRTTVTMRRVRCGAR